MQKFRIWSKVRDISEWGDIFTAEPGSSIPNTSVGREVIGRWNLPALDSD
jgi:hypothetical protein